MRPSPIPPPVLSALPPLNAALGVETWTIHLKTITPMFGGGAVAGEVDPVLPIRAAAIRGHLRYWWRATAGSAFADSSALFAAEEAIWGSANQPGAVAIMVTIDNLGKSEPFDKLAPKADPQRGPREGVFLFPFAEQKREGIPATSGRVDVAFTLTLASPSEIKGQVRQAVLAWILFGGVGARTRRGLGVLTVREHAADWLPSGSMTALPAYLQSLAGSTSSAVTPRFSRLKGGMACFGERENSAMAAWRTLGGFWSRFRKGHYTSTDLTPMNGGKWPDHNALLNLRPIDRDIALAKPFLGLPIIYQKFPAKGNVRASFAGDLEAAESGRMASPIILKPVAFADGSVRPMVARLAAPVPKDVKVRSRVLALRAPAPDTPVLAALRARDPLDAAVQAAIQAGFLEGGRM